MSEVQSLDLEAPIAAAPGGIRLAALDDIENQAARFESALAMVSRCTSAPTDLAQLVDDAAALIAKAIDIDYFGVARLRDEGQTTLFHFGKTDLWEEKRKAVEHKLSLHRLKSASAFAVEARRPVVIRDLESENRFEDAVLTRHGLISAAICPLAYQDRVFGTLGVYGSQPREFSREEVELVGSVALQLGAVMAHRKVEKKLADQTNFLTAVVDHTANLCLVLTPDGCIESCNGACEQVTGFALEEVKDRHIWGAFLIPEEVGLMKDAFNRLRASESSAAVETFVLTKHGERKRVAWSFAATRNDDDELESFVGTGADVTATYDALEELDKIQAAADRTKQALGEMKERIENGELVEASLAGSARSNGRNGPMDAKHDRRRRRRAPFPYKQILAPLKDGALPPLGEYSEVFCRDISPGGFSFFVDEAPENKSEYVIAFGVPPHQTFLTAEVVHSSPVRHEGREVYVVGCRYTGRVEY